MKICNVVATLTLLLVLPNLAAAQTAISQVPNPRTGGSWVADVAGVIDANTEQRLDELIDGAHRDLDIEIAVVTVDRVDAATPKDFATGLFNTWGIGDATKNNGLLVLMVMSERRLEMETGYGTETVLTDGWLKRMQGNEMVPLFRQGRFGEGLYAGVDASVARIREFAEQGILPETSGGFQPLQAEEPSDSSGTILVVGGIVLFGLLIAGLIAVRNHRWKKERTCTTCEELMMLLPDAEDDVHLDEGQKTEEAIGAIDWEYWYCRTCNFSKLLPNHEWFSGYEYCPECRNKTVSNSTTTVSSPTRHSTGLERITEKCAHCNYRNSYTRILPKLPPPPSTTSSSSSWSSSSSSSSSWSSSSSSSSSFGGGSSGGGGAGSSW